MDYYLKNMLKKLLPILLICAFGFLLRIYQIDKVPPSLNWDEVSHGYNAYSILKTGKDEWGKNFPISNFRAYGDYPLPLNLYVTLPFIKLLGLNEFAIRFPHALLGTITILSSYFLFLGITKNKKLSIFGAFLVAIDPWHLFTSRFVLQSNLSVALLTASAAFFVNGINTKKKYLLPVAFTLLGLTLFSYHSTRIFAPILLVAIAIIYRQKLLEHFKSKTGIISAVLILLFFAPLPVLLNNPEARARANWIFLVDKGAIAKIEEQRNQSTLTPIATKLLYNRPVFFAQKFASNYLGYFSPQYLFLKGGTQYQFSIPDNGVLYSAYLPFFYLGLFILIKRAKNNKNYQFVLAWLLMAPIAASVTQEKYAVLRSTAMLPIPELLTVLGGYKIFEIIQARKAWLSKSLAIGFAALLLFQVSAYLKNMFFVYPVAYSQDWQYGYKEVVTYIKTNYQKYDKIIITKKYGEPHEFLLFFWPWDPASYENDPNLVRFAQSEWFWVDRFDKFYFMNDWDIPKETNKSWKLESGGTISVIPKKTLLITSPGSHPPDWNLLEKVDFLDGKPAFEILEKM